MNKKILLLDGQTIQSLAIAKALKSRKYFVVSFCDSKTTYGYRTKYSDEKIICPSLIDKPKEFKLFLLNFLKNNKIDVIIPMNDYSASFLSLNKDELKTLSNFTIPDIGVFNNGYDKNKLMTICEENNYPHPISADLEKLSFEDACDKVGFPSLIKPNITTGGRGITLVNSREEFLNKQESIKEEFGPSHLQEFINQEGRQFKVQIFIDEKKKLIASTVIHKMRFYPVNGGSSCCNLTVENKDLVNLCFNVLKTIEWEGFADFDLIEDTNSNEFKIMEINPRVPACIKSSIISGVDFANIISDHTLNNQQAKYIYKPGKYLRYFGLELLWFLGSKDRFKTKPSWFNFVSSKVSFQEGGLDDIKPFLYGTIGGFLKQLNPEFRKKKSGMRN